MVAVALIIQYPICRCYRRVTAVMQSVNVIVSYVVTYNVQCTAPLQLLWATLFVCGSCTVCILVSGCCCSKLSYTDSLRCLAAAACWLMSPAVAGSYCGAIVNAHLSLWSARWQPILILHFALHISRFIVFACFCLCPLIFQFSGARILDEGVVVMGVIAHRSSVEMHGMSDRCRHFYGWSS